MRLAHPEGPHSLEHAERVRHAAVAVRRDLVEELARRLDLHGGGRVLVVAGDVEEAIGVRDGIDRFLERAPARDQLRHHRERAPARGVEEADVVVAQVDAGRRQMLVGGMEAVEDAQQGHTVVELVDLVEGLDAFFRAGERLDDAEGSPVGRAEHDEAAAAALAGGILHRPPYVGMELDEAARDQPAHRVGEQVHGLARAPAPHEVRERGGALVDVEPPVEGERLGLPAGLQLEEEVRVDGPDAGGAHGVRRRQRHPVKREPQVVEAAGQDPEHVDPDAVAVAARVHGVELRPHEAGEHDDAALGRAAACAPRRLVESRQPLVAELRGEDLAVRRREREGRGPDRLDVAPGQRPVERGQARTVPVARHGRRLLPAREWCQWRRAF